MPANAQANNPSFSRSKQFIANAFILCGFLLFSLSLLHRYLRTQALTLDKETVANIAAASYETNKPRPIPVYVTLGSLIKADVSTQVYTNGNWTIAEQGVSYLEQSARPGEQGNIILYGHNTKESLYQLKNVPNGATMSLRSEDGQEHLYTVTLRKIVSPSQIEFLQPSSTEIVTIYTCIGPLDSKRLILQAVPFNP